MQQALAHCSRDEYLRLDQGKEAKHEFFQGEVFAMGGETFNHAAIGLNIATMLAASLRGGPCRPMNSDMRVHTPGGLDTYPDVSVFCGEPELTDQQRTLLNPVVIVEVLSPTTRSYDRGDKFALYRAIPGLQDYLLVDSEQRLVEHYRRLVGGEWLLHEYRDSDDEVVLGCRGTVLSLAVMYAGVGL